MSNNSENSTLVFIAGVIFGIILYSIFFSSKNEDSNTIFDLQEQVDDLQSCVYDYEDLMGDIEYQAGNTRYSIENYELEDAYSYSRSIEELSQRDICY